MREAAGNGAALATVCIGDLDFSTVDESVGPLYGNWPLPRFAVTALNYGLPRLLLPNLSKQCAETLSSGGILHYLAEDINPWITGGRVAVTIHGNPMATLQTDRYYSFRRGYKIAVAYNLRQYGREAVGLVESEYVRRGLQEFGYDGIVSVVPPAVDPIFQPSGDRAGLRRSLGLPLDRKILLSISSGERRKNLQILPRVMDLLPSDYVLLRVGPSVRGSQDLRSLSDIDVARVYGACDALLFPTLEEGFGYPVIEAFASGLPVVASDIPVMSEVAGGAALLVDPMEPPALAAACKTAIDNHDSMAREGLVRATQYGLPGFTLRLREFYRHLGRQGSIDSAN